MYLSGVKLMRRSILTLCLCVLFLGSHASGKGVDFVTLQNPTVRPAKAGLNSAAFVTLENRSPSEIKLVKASCPVAKIVELHRSFNENGIHKMRPVEHIAIPAGEQVALETGGLHIMLINLEADIEMHPDHPTTIPITLTFDSGDSVEAHFLVEKGCGFSCH